MRVRNAASPRSISSQVRASETKSRPAPPYSSGITIPSSPSSAIPSIADRSSLWLMSFSMAFGSTRSSTNVRTVSWIRRCSSLSSKSTRRVYAEALGRLTGPAAGNEREILVLERELGPAKVDVGGANQEGERGKQVPVAGDFEFVPVAEAAEQGLEASRREAPKVGVAPVRIDALVEGTVINTTPPGARLRQRFATATPGRPTNCRVCVTMAHSKRWAGSDSSPARSATIVASRFCE